MTSTLTTSTCRYCGRTVTQTDEGWVDTEATGDDRVWRETCDANESFFANHAPMPTLSERMDFDHVIQVNPDGWITEPKGVYGPELIDDEIATSEWTLLDGFSGQQGYSGPMMHASEQIGGGLERHILANPGQYVALVNYTTDDEEPESWAVAFRPTPDQEV